MVQKRKRAAGATPINTPYKDSDSPSQLQVVYLYLREHIATGSMVEEATAIKQKSVCRYKRKLEESGLLFEAYKSTCPITGHKATFLTCDPRFKPQNHQLSLFETINTK